MALAIILVLTSTDCPEGEKTLTLKLVSFEISGLSILMSAVFLMAQYRTPVPVTATWSISNTLQVNGDPKKYLID